MDHRIVTLTPAATEIAFLLGLGDFIVGRSYDSVYPLDEVRKIPVVSMKGLSKPTQAKTKEQTHRGVSVLHLDQRKLSRLKPTLILTTEECESCPSSFSHVSESHKVFSHNGIDVLSLHPKNISDVIDNILQVAEFARTSDQAKSALIRLNYRMENVAAAVKNAAKPTVGLIDWLDPLRIPGTWVPEMLAIAGGKMILSKAGERSKYMDWYEIVNANPDYLVMAPSGLEPARAKKEIFLFKHRLGWDKLKAVRNNHVYYMDGGKYLRQPGPRLVDGIEVFARILHPKIFGSPFKSEAELIV